MWRHWSYLKSEKKWGLRRGEGGREGGDGQLISFQVWGVEVTLRCEGPEEPRSGP